MECDKQVLGEFKEILPLQISGHFTPLHSNQHSYLACLRNQALFWMLGGYRYLLLTEAYQGRKTFKSALAA